MIRLNLVVEGQTEEVFVNKLLRPHLAKFNIVCVPRLIFTGKKYGRVFRGGVTRYHNFKWDLILWMREDKSPDSYFTTMLDLYGLPGDFPGQARIRSVNDPLTKVGILERAIARDIDDPRFIPYIQLHEFEALLLTNPKQFSRYFIGQTESVESLEKISQAYPNPEFINQGPLTAPSKRIGALLPSYTRLKAVAGPVIALAIGLQAMRKKCAHFNDWLNRLESLNLANVESD